MGSYIEYGSGNNTVHIDLDQNTHNGGGGHDRLILHARNEKSGLQFGLLTSWWRATCSGRPISNTTR